ncbi:MAG: DUF1801 domain-containing protein [Verrucomicrobiaceae bacterium]|nr:MAG: DUF1801 domain-containing protein [Verrucomicrobiaceae bacterium]
MSNRNPAVEDFLRTLDHPHKTEIEHIRSLILTAPGVREKVKWNAPTFGLQGKDQITFHLRAKGIMLVLHRGVKSQEATDLRFEDPDGLLEWPAKDRAILKIQTKDELDAKEEAIAKLVHRWLVES